MYRTYYIVPAVKIGFMGQSYRSFTALYKWAMDM